MIDWTAAVITIGSVLVTGALGAWGISAQKAQAERGWEEQRALASEAREQERRAAVYLEAITELGRWQAIRARELGQGSLPPLAIPNHEVTLGFAARLSLFGSKEANNIWDEWVRVGTAYEAARRSPGIRPTADELLQELGRVAAKFREQVRRELGSSSPEGT